MHHTRIIVCGGGNIAHSLVAAIARHEEVGVLTRQPGRWSRSVNDSPYQVWATDDVTQVASAEVVLVAVPQFAVEVLFARLRPHLKPGQLVCFAPANSLMPMLCAEAKALGIDLACIQRVPYIARIREYGKSVAMSAPRANHRVFLSGETSRTVLDELCQRDFEAPTSYLRSPLSFVFNNSNPLLHPARMVVLFRNWRERVCVENPLFYGEWTDESSELYIEADREMFRVLQAADPSGSCALDYEDVLTHYGVRSVHELTVKIRSIESFSTIRSPMKQEGTMWFPDFESRYFTEDVEYGLKPILGWAEKCQVATPVLESLAQELEAIRDRGAV